MAGIFLGIISLMYLATAINYVITGNAGMGIAFACYAFANYGLWLAGK